MKPLTFAQVAERACLLRTKARPDGTFSCPKCPDTLACLRAAAALAEHLTPRTP